MAQCSIFKIWNSVSCGSSISNFWETSILFSVMAVPIYMFTNSVQEFSFLYFLDNTYLLSFGNSHSNVCEVSSLCSFDLHFPDDWRTFSCSCWPFVYSLGECLLRSFDHFSTGLKLFCYWVVWVSPFLFWILTQQIYGLQIFYPIL